MNDFCSARLFPFSRHFWRNFFQRAGQVSLAISLSVAPSLCQEAVRPGVKSPDWRLTRLKQYFRSHRSPLEKVSENFVVAADRYNLDWRLLPSLAVIESGGGKRYRRNNIFGWKSGRARFKSLDQAIDYVASRLAESPIYRGKSISELLKKYNPARPIYAKKVIQIMDSLAPETPLAAAVP